MDERPENTRTSVVGKRIARPCRVTSITSSSSDAMRAFTSATPSGSCIAILPPRRTLVKSDSALRRTSPAVVANTIWSSSQWSSGRSTGNTAAMPVPCVTGRSCTIGLPRVVRVPCGSCQHLRR